MKANSQIVEIEACSKNEHVLPLSSVIIMFRTLRHGEELIYSLGWFL